MSSDGTPPPQTPLEAFSDADLESAASAALTGHISYSIGAVGAAILLARFVPAKQRLLPLIPLGLLGAALDFRAGSADAASFRDELERRKSATSSSAAR